MTVYVGDLLTATAASVTGKPTPSRTWQWLRNGTAISGATSSTYTTVEADLAANISVRQTETNIAGTAEATSLTVGPVATFTPAVLFASGEEGAWYEPSTTTAFSDLEGFNLATYGQGVAHLVDKSKGATIEARRNRLRYTEQFNDGVWVKGSGTVSPNTSETTDPLGGNTADKLTHASAINVYQFISNPSGDMTFSAYLKKSGSQSTCELYIYEGGVGFVVSFEFNFDTESYSLAQGSGSATMQSVGDGWYRCSVIATLPASVSCSHGVYNATEVYAWGAQLETGSTATAYQKITTGQTLSWFPGNHATQVTAGARPILARVPEGGRRNLLASSYDLNNASWTKVNTPTVSASGTDPFGDAAYSVADDFSDFEWIVSPSITAATSTNHTVSFFVKKTTSATSFPGFSFLVGSNFQSVGINTDTGAILDRTVQSGGSANTTVTDYNADWWRIEITRSATSGNALRLDLFPAVMAGGTLSGTWDGATTGSAIFAAPQLETGSTATAYQKVVSEYDITEAGVTSLEYLSFDGADDSLEMSSAVPVTNNWFSCWGGNFDAYANYHGAWRWLNEGANPSAIDTNRLEEYTRITRDRVIYSRVDIAGSQYNSVSAYPVAGTDMVVFANRSVEEVTLGEIYPGSSRQLLTPLDLPYSTTGSATMSLARAYSGDFAPMTLYGIVFVWGDVSSIERGKANEYMAAKSGVVL